MDLARVIGTVVATQRDPLFGGLRLVVVQPLNERMEAIGTPAVAIDALSRNFGEVVWLVRSGDAMMAHPGDHYVPTDCAVGGMVDRLDLAAQRTDS